MMWKLVKLGDMLDIQNGYAFNSKQFDADGDMPLIRIRDLKNGFDTETRYTGKYDDKYVVNSGDLLIGMDGEFRCYEWQGVAALLNQRVCRLQNFHADLNQRFLLYAINSELKKIEDVTGFTTVKHLSSKTIKQIELPIPPLPEQERIVAKLDAAFAAIEMAVEVETSHIATMQQLKEATIISGFSKLDDNCEMLHLADVCVDFSRGKSKHRPRNDERLYGDAIPFVQTGDISNAKKYLSDYKKMYSQFGIEQSKQWSKGTVCITIAANIAELAILDIKACFPDSVIGALPNKNITSSEYLFYLLNYFQKKIKSKSKGFAQQNINLATFKDETFPFPSLENQKKITSELAELDGCIDRIIDIKKEKVGALIALQGAILAEELQSDEAA